jgi:hypothetical protein
VTESYAELDRGHKGEVLDAMQVDLRRLRYDWREMNRPRTRATRWSS